MLYTHCCGTQHMCPQPTPADSSHSGATHSQPQQACVLQVAAPDSCWVGGCCIWGSPKGWGNAHRHAAQGRGCCRCMQHQRLGAVDRQCRQPGHSCTRHSCNNVELLLCCQGLDRPTPVAPPLVCQHCTRFNTRGGMHTWVTWAVLTTHSWQPTKGAHLC
jgi:hypothetical protein